MGLKDLKEKLLRAASPFLRIKKGSYASGSELQAGSD
jgi:hypothetical protein